MTALVPIAPKRSPTAYATIAAWVALMLHATLATVLSLRSNGTYMDDELRHFLVARTARHGLRFLLDIWGRPGFTIPFAPAANFGDMPAGFMATRLLTVFVMVLAGWVTWRTARQLHAPFPWLAPWILLMMPLWVGLSYTPTTEAVAALYTIMGTCQLARGHHRWAAIWFALLPLSRHEMIVLLVPVAIYFLFRRDFLTVLLLGWAEAAWNLMAVLIGMKPPLLRFISPLEQGNLGSGNVLHYVNRWMEMASISGVGLVLVGSLIVALHDGMRWRRLVADGTASRRARLRCFVAAGAVGLVVLHSVLYHFNRFASGGYARFLIPAAPWMAITALYPIGVLLKSRRTGARILLLGVAAVLWGSRYSGSWVDVDPRWRTAAALAVTIAALWPIRFFYMPGFVSTDRQHENRLPLVGLMSAIALALMTIVSMIQVREAARPYVMGPHQLLMRRAITDLRKTYPDERIVGASPWVKYFLNDLMDEAEVEAQRRWETCDPPGMIYLYDQSHATAVRFERFARYPHEVIAVWSLPTDGDEPYLKVLRRKPD